MIEAYCLHKDKVMKKKLDRIGKDKCWIRLIKPTPNEIEEVAKIVNIPYQEMIESLEEEERPRLTVMNYVEIIYRVPFVLEEEISTSPLYLYIVNSTMITIEKNPEPILDQVTSSFSKGKSRFLFKKGFPYFIHYVLDKVNDEFLLKINKIATNINIYEEVTKRDLTREDLEKIYEQSVTLSLFNQALIANLEVLNSLKKVHSKFFKQTDVALFEELYYDALQILDTEKVQREAITNLFNLQTALASSRLNEFMKKLTSLAIIMAIPTMISGIYGMNFTYIPLRHSPFGFYITAATIMLITISVLYVFRKANWV